MPNAPAPHSFEVTKTCLLGPDSPRMQASLGPQSCIRIIHQRTCRLGRGLRHKEIPRSCVMIDNSGNKKRKNLVTTGIAQFIIFIVPPKQDCKHYCSTIYVHTAWIITLSKKRSWRRAFSKCNSSTSETTLLIILSEFGSHFLLSENKCFITNTCEKNESDPTPTSWIWPHSHKKQATN